MYAEPKDNDTTPTGCSRMNILVTGSSGFVGSHLVPALQSRGHQVVGIDRKVPDTSEPDVFIKGDLLDLGVLKRGIDGVDAIYHLAAAKDDWGISRKEFFRENVVVTQAILDASAKENIQRHVFYSTVAVHGPGEEPTDESAPYSPTIAYGESKVECEKLYKQYASDNSGASVLLLRPSAIYGARQPWRTNVYRLIDTIYKKRFLMIGNGDALKTTSYIENLLAANHFLVERLQSGVHAYIYVDEPVMSTERLVRLIYRKLGRKPPRFSLPLALARPIARVSDFAADLTGIDFPITAARIEKFCTSTNFDGSAIRELGFEQPVDNSTAVRRTVEWQLRHYQGQ